MLPIGFWVKDSKRLPMRHGFYLQQQTLGELFIHAELALSDQMHTEVSR
jgi:hypothetical protein